MEIPAEAAFNLVTCRGSSRRLQELCSQPARAVIFLDVDGVLANARSMMRDYQDSDNSLIHDPLGASPAIHRMLNAAAQGSSGPSSAGVSQNSAE